MNAGGTGANLLVEADGLSIAFQTPRHLHDLDGDGQPELFCAKGPWGRNGTSLQLVKQDGSPTMQVRWKSSPETMFHAFDFDDVDGDGPRICPVRRRNALPRPL